jgi:hypothetical protein
LSNGNIRSHDSGDSGEDAVGGRFHFHHGFVGFDFEKGIAFGDAVAIFFPPGDELAGFLRHLEGGHDNAEGHSVFIWCELTFSASSAAVLRGLCG